MNLTITDLTFAYDRRAPVVRDVSVVAAPARITAVIGPNAAGKSTLLRCMIGVLRPDTGCVLLGDEDVHDMSPRRRAARIAYVAQRPGVSAGFTVRDVVELGRYALDADDAAIEQAMRAMDVQQLGERPYRELSAGQQQRVMLARALGQCDAGGVYVLDEPTAAMDLNRTAQTMAVLREQAAKGATVVLAIHDLSRAARVADDVWLMQEGGLVASGPVAEVMQPEVLQRVFAVEVRWARDDAGGMFLVS